MLVVKVMSIGRSFEEAMQKAVRMVAPGSPGLEGLDIDEDEVKLVYLCVHVCK